LANQGYHWQARVLDGNGVASSWVSFSANSTDFVVNALHLPSAQFTWNPVTVFEVDTVQFTAAAVGQTGLAFNWDFGVGNTASGATASQTFAGAGQATVTLAVTDAQNHQSQHSETITVVTKQLEGYINQLAQQTEGALDQLLAQAQEAAVAADTFQQGVDAAPTQLGVSLAFGIIGAGLSSSDLKEFLASSLPQVNWDLETGLGDQIAQKATEVLLASHASRGYQDIFIPGLGSYITQKKTGLEQLRQQALAATGALTPAQAEQLARDLHARAIGNLALSDSYATKMLLPTTFEQMRDTIEGGWDFATFWGSVTLTVVTAGSSGLAAFLLAESANLAQSTLDQLNILSAQSMDVQMLAFSLDAVGHPRPHPPAPRSESCRCGLPGQRPHGEAKANPRDGPSVTDHP
jgi:PKD repeat protein